MKIYAKIAKIRCNVARTRSELVGIADVSEQVHGGRPMGWDGMGENEKMNRRNETSGPNRFE